MSLPAYEMIINPDQTSDVEVQAIAFVGKPAIERNFLAFNSQKLHFAVNEEKRIVSGPAMIPDSLIYRRDEQGEYNVFFSQDTVKQIALKFFQKDYHKNLNLFHDPSLSLEGVTIFESFISDKSRGIHPMKGFEDLPDGSWFISAKVDNDLVWQKIKSGEVKGFSVEGIFSFLKKGQNGTDRLNSHISVVNEELMSDIKNNLKTMFEDLKKTIFGPTDVVPPPVDPATAPAPAQVLNTDYQLKDGTAVSIDKLEAGGVVLVNGAPAMPGELELADGTKVTVAEGGVIATVTPGTPAAPDFSSQFATYDQKFADYETKLQGYEERFAKQDQAIQKAQAINEQLFAIVTKLAEAPQADPITEPKTSFSAQRADSKETARKNFIEALQKIKK